MARTPPKTPPPEPVTTVPHDLCQLLHFVPQVFVKDGVSYLGWMSRFPTLVTNEARSTSGIGDCKHICATLVYNRGLGGLQLAIRTHGLQCVGGYANVRGELRFLLHGVLRGTVTIWSSDSDCQFVAAAEGEPPAGTSQNCGTNSENCRNNGPGYGTPPGGIDLARCQYTDSPLCIYCVPLEANTDCSIETEQRCTPCGTDESLGRGFAPPGARIDPQGPIGGANPQQSSHDLFLDDQRFYANDGSAGLVRYYLKGFRGYVSPIFPDPTFVGRALHTLCCTWLCNFMVNYDAEKAWRLFCTEVLQAPFPQTRRQTDPRFFTISFSHDRICLIHFNFANVSGGCFQLRDQFCFTAGTPDLAPDDLDYWAHLHDGDGTLTVLDSLRMSLNMRFATDTARYRFREPECQKVCDDAIFGVRNLDGMQSLDRPSGSGRNFKYDDPLLNKWSRDKGWPDCATAPAVRRGGGAPWTVYVQPHGTGCKLPADLVYRRVVTTLHLSVERAEHGFIQSTSGIRALATFRCVVFLGVRLRPGWEDIPCPVQLAFGGACDPSFVNPENNLILTADECSTVPLSLEWRGMQGPRPWSKGPGLFQTPRSHARCCDALSVIDGLVIPGEVNNFGSPDGPQVFGGDVVLGLNIPPESFGC